MAIVRIPDENRTFRDAGEVTEYLARIGIEYARWGSQDPGNSSVSRSCRLDTALYEQWNRPRLPAGLSGTLVYSGADWRDSALTPALLDESLRTILLDIEGTTTPLYF